MSDFEAALRGTIAHPNKGFEQADADLREETNIASLAVANLTNNRGSLSLGPPREDAAGVWYELQLLFRTADQRNDDAHQGANRTKKYILGTLFIPWQGYPIGLREKQPPELPNRASIAAYFVEMARNPTSPLVNYITFNLRRQEQPVAGG
jgi:hypothetical protein